MVPGNHENICGSIHNHNDMQLLAMGLGSGDLLSDQARPDRESSVTSVKRL